MGDDERNEYIYKFVSEGAYTPEDRADNMRLLEHGTLYAARFSADGSGEWLPLVQGQHGLDAAAGFPSQAEVVIQARAAADVVGATKMDRPEWIAVHPTTKEVYCTLTNNTTRGTDKGPAVDAANPRANNVYGHIIRWREQGGDPCATRFAWNVFVLCGDPAMPEPDKHGTIRATSSVPRMGSGSMRAASCGFRPISRRASSIRATMPTSGTIRCWPLMWRPGRCGDSSRVRTAAR